jgi:uncharacterized protein
LDRALTRRPLVLYLHGFRSSPESSKARAMADEMARRGMGDAFACPALSHVPDEAIAQAEAVIAGNPNRRITLVGSSLGGFFATCLAERHDLPAVLINPAVPASIPLEFWIGRHDNFHTGEWFDFTREHAEQIRRLDPPALNPDRYWLLLEAGDEVLDPREALRRYAGARVSLEENGDHSFTRFDAYLPRIIAFAGL